MAKEEALKWLEEFITEINNQDNRGTACPYYYDLRYRNEEGYEEHVGYGGTVFFTQKATDEYIEDNGHNLPKGVYTFLCWGGRNPELKQLLESIGAAVGVPHERK